MTDQHSAQTKREVPTLLHDGEEWVRARYYDRAVEVRENANAVSVRVEVENRRLREALEAVAQEPNDGYAIAWEALHPNA